MSPRFALGLENVPCVAEVVNRSLKADCTNFTSLFEDKYDNLVKKNRYQILAYHVSNTYTKLAPDSILNKKIKEIMRYTGVHWTSPFSSVVNGIRNFSFR